ncbi:MAG: outer membrane protein transport protein [bacterium]
MTRLSALRGSALVTVGLLAQAVWADGFRNPPDTAAALGKSGNNIVWVDDASALFYNPANLVDVPSRQVQFSTLIGYSHADYHGQLGQTDTDRPWSMLPAFALAWPLPETDLAMGFGMHVPYGRQTRWDTSGAFRYAAPVFSKMMVADFSPALAWRVSDSISVGAGPDIYYGRLQFRQLLPILPGSRITADADGYAVGGNAGVTWRMTPNQRLVLTYRSPFDMKFKGDMETHDIPPPAVNASDVDTTFKFPTIVALGYGIQLTETFRVETKVEWLQFSRYKTMAIDAGDNRTLVNALGLANTPQNWNDTWTFGMGADWRFVPDWTLRAGYLYLPSPIPDSTFAPTALDVDQSVVSVGLGYQKGSHTIDLAYALGIFDTRSVHSNQNPLYQQGTYDFQGHLFALTYTYAF